MLTRLFLLGVCLFTLCWCQFQASATDTSTTTYTKVLTLQYVAAGELVASFAGFTGEKGPKIQPGQSNVQTKSPLKEYIPEGITSIVALPGNKLLISATSHESFNQLGGFINMLDRPISRVAVEIVQVRVNMDSLKEIEEPAAEAVKNADPQNSSASTIIFDGEKNQDILIKLLATGQAEILLSKRTILDNGQQGTIDFRPNTPVTGLSIDEVLIHADESVSLAFSGLPKPEKVTEPIKKNTFPQLRMRLKNHSTMMLGSYTEEKTEKPAIVLILCTTNVLPPLLLDADQPNTSGTQ